MQIKQTKILDRQEEKLEIRRSLSRAKHGSKNCKPCAGTLSIDPIDLFDHIDREVNSVNVVPGIRRLFISSVRGAHRAKYLNHVISDSDYL